MPATLSLKGEIIYIIGFGDIQFSVVITQISHYSTKATIENTIMNGQDCIPVKLYFQKHAVDILNIESKLVFARGEV